MEAIARLIQSRRHRQRYAQIVASGSEDVHPQLEALGEENSLFKFVNLLDPTGLAELREYSRLKSSTVRELLTFATNNLDPAVDLFWEVIDVVHETSRLRASLECSKEGLS